MRMKGVLFGTILFLLAACGSAAETVEPPPPEPTQTSQPAQPTSPAPSGLICEDPPPEELALGSAIDSIIEVPLWTRCFWVQVPDGADRVAFHLSGLSSDLTLSVGYGYLISVQYNADEFWEIGRAHV